MSWDEFEELTPGMFQQLCKRRNAGIRYERYANALTAAAVYNVNRGSTDDMVVSAFDFVRDEKSAAKRERIREAKRFIRKAIGTLPMTTSPDKFREVRVKVIANLVNGGVSDAEKLFDECWPSLKPAEEEAHE